MYQVINCEKLHNAVEESMKLLNDAPIIGCENQDRKDRSKDLSLVINVNDINEITISKAIPCDLYALVEYDLEFGKGIKDFEENWDYTYHQLFTTYYNQCINELIRDNDTRRAVLPIAGSKSYGNPHPPCMQNMMFRIIDGKLNTTATFRSNDGVKAFAMNSFAIARLAHEIAAKVGVDVGSYTHIAQSFHAYSHDWDMLESYCKMFNNRTNEKLYYTLDEYSEVYNEYADEYIFKCIKRWMDKIKRTDKIKEALFG